MDWNLQTFLRRVQREDIFFHIYLLCECVSQWIYGGHRDIFKSKSFLPLWQSRDWTQMDRLGRKHLYPLIHHAGPGKALFWNRFFYFGVMIADPEAVVNSLGSRHQPFFMLTDYSFPAMVSVLEKAWVFKLHLYIRFLEFLACLRKTDRACGSWCIV